MALADFRIIAKIVTLLMTPSHYPTLLLLLPRPSLPTLPTPFPEPFPSPLPFTSLLPSPLSYPPPHLSTHSSPHSPLPSLLPFPPYTACGRRLRLGSILTRLRCRRPSERCGTRWGYGKIPCSVPHAVEAQESWMVLIRFLEAVNVILACEGWGAFTSTETRTAQARTSQLFIWLIVNCRIELLYIDILCYDVVWNRIDLFIIFIST